MGFLSRFLGRNGKSEDIGEEGPNQVDMSQLTTQLDLRLEKTRSEAVEKTRVAVREILREKAAAQGIVEQIKEIDFDDDIKDRTYKPVLTSKPVYVRGMLEGFKGIRDGEPKDFEELTSFYDRATKSLKTIQNVQHKKGRYMSFAFQKEMLSLGTHLNNMIDASARLETEISGAAAVSDEADEIKDEIAKMESEIQRLNEDSHKAAEHLKKTREVEGETESKTLEIERLKESEEYKTHLELEAGLEAAEKNVRDLDTRVNSLISPLIRPFRKYEKLLERSKTSTDKKLLGKLREYEKSPKQAFCCEEPGGMVLPALLTGLKDAITRGELKLSERERKKTIHRINELEDTVLAELLLRRNSLEEASANLRERLTEPNVMQRIEELTSQLETLKKEHRKKGDDDKQNPMEKIALHDLKDTIELRAKSFLKQRVELVIPELKSRENE